jgi:hypothetical protein
MPAAQSGEVWMSKDFSFAKTPPGRQRVAEKPINFAYRQVRYKMSAGATAGGLEPRNGVGRLFMAIDVSQERKSAPPSVPGGRRKRLSGWKRNGCQDLSGCFPATKTRSHDKRGKQWAHPVF